MKKFNPMYAFLAHLKPRTERELAIRQSIQEDVESVLAEAGKEKPEYFNGKPLDNKATKYLSERIANRLI